MLSGRFALDALTVLYNVSCAHDGEWWLPVAALAVL